MRKIIKEIRLKKDTPDHRAGEMFVLMSNKGIYEMDAGEDDPAVFYGGDIKNFDEWFEEESVEWLHDRVSYYEPAVSSLAKKFVPWHNRYWGNAYDEAKRRIGFCYKTGEACRRFIDFLTAVETVRHDEGFMKYNKTCCEVWELRRMYLDVNGRFTAHKVESEFLHDLGAFYFDTEEHAKASIKKHPKEWGIIMNYDWSKGEDEEEDEEN